MSRLIYDGEKIVVNCSNHNKDVIKSLAEKYNGQYLLSIDAFIFPRTLQSVLDLGSIEGVVHDKSFKEIYAKVKKTVENRQKALMEKIDSYHLPQELYQFQKEAVIRMLESERNILLASDPGCGKSCMSINYLTHKENSLPCLVVCPASLKVNWQMEFEKWGKELKTEIVYGRDSFCDSRYVAKLKTADVIIINYDILGIDDKDASNKEKERIATAKANGWKYRKAFVAVKGWAKEFNENFNFKTILADECQYIESLKAIRSRAVIQVCKDENIKKIFLSGTPFETRVRQFYNACHILASDLFPSESNFLFRYCDPKKGYFGWTFDGLSNAEELRRKLDLFMIRHKKEDVLSQLPPKQNIPIYLDMDSKSRKSYDDMEDELMSKKEGLQQFTYLAEMKKALTEIKKDAVVQYIKDMLEIEDKLVVFTYHTSMFDYLMDKFGAIAVGINGSTPNIERQPMVNKFQKDSKIKLFIGQIQACSTGITLTASHTVIFTEWGMTCSSMVQASDRVCRIGQNADRCLIYYLIVKDTIDEAPLGNLNSHYKDIDSVLNGSNDSKLLDVNDSMIVSVKRRYLLRNKSTLSLDY